MPELTSREIDAAVAERMMGWKRPSGLPDGTYVTPATHVPGDTDTLHEQSGKVYTQSEYREAACWKSPEGEWRSQPPPFSTSWEWAGKVVEKLHAQRNPLSLSYQTGLDEPFDEFMWIAEFRRGRCALGGSKSAYAVAKTAPEAICRAALKAEEVEP